MSSTYTVPIGIKSPSKHNATSGNGTPSFSAEKSLSTPSLSTTPTKSRPWSVPVSSPSPGRKSGQFEEYKMNFQNFHSNLEIRCKSVLYDLSVGDISSASQEIKNTLQQSKLFVPLANTALDKLELNDKALTQKTATIQEYIKQLNLENNDLKRRITQYEGLTTALMEDDMGDWEGGSSQQEEIPMKKKKVMVDSTLEEKWEKTEDSMLEEKRKRTGGSIQEGKRKRTGDNEREEMPNTADQEDSVEGH